MAMIMSCWHALKLEGVHLAVAQPCVDQIRHNIYRFPACAKVSKSVSSLEVFLS
jgi:hypothetical protein